MLNEHLDFNHDIWSKVGSNSTVIPPYIPPTVRGSICGGYSSTVVYNLDLIELEGFGDPVLRFLWRSLKGDCRNHTAFSNLYLNEKICNSLDSCIVLVSFLENSDDNAQFSLYPSKTYNYVFECEKPYIIFQLYTC